MKISKIFQNRDRIFRFLKNFGRYFFGCQKIFFDQKFLMKIIVFFCKSQENLPKNSFFLPKMLRNAIPGRELSETAKSPKILKKDLKCLNYAI